MPLTLLPLFSSIFCPHLALTVSKIPPGKWSRITDFCQTFTSKCLKRTLVRVSLKCEGHRTDSMITTRRSLGFTSRCLKRDKMCKIKLASSGTHHIYPTIIFNLPKNPKDLHLDGICYNRPKVFFTNLKTTMLS